MSAITKYDDEAARIMRDLFFGQKSISGKNRDGTKSRFFAIHTIVLYCDVVDV